MTKAKRVSASKKMLAALEEERKRPKYEPTPAQTQLATWLRAQADSAEKGLVRGCAAVVLNDAPEPITCNHYPIGSSDILALAGGLWQVQFQIQAIDYNNRMQAIARQVDQGAKVEVRA